MRPHLMRLFAVALVAVLCQIGAEQGHATVIRDGKAPPALPAVESGGHRLTHTQQPIVPYSFIGAISASHHMYPAFVFWPWRMLRSYSLHRPGGPAQNHALSVTDFPFGLPLFP